MKQPLQLLSLAIVFLLASCSDTSKTSETDNLFKFKDYISYHTYGNQSIGNPITIELAKPLDQFEVDQELPTDILDIDPKIPGKLVLENGGSLVFQPAEFLKPDTEYRVTLKLKELYPDVDKEFRKFTFAFKTITPNFKIDLGALQSYDKNYQYLEGSIIASDLIDVKKASNLLEVEQDGKKLSLILEDQIAYASRIAFRIDSIQRKVDDDKIRISWNGDPVNAKSKGSEEFEIPGRNNFKVVSLESTYAPQSRLKINFSDPLESDQDFNGLVTLQSASDLRFEVDGNVLMVYPNNRITGTARVTLFTGLKNTEGFSLKNEFSELVSFEQLKPAVRLLSKGVILPDAASTPLYFEAVNLSAVDVRVIQIFEDNMLQFLQTSNLNNSNRYDIKRVGRRIAHKTIELNPDELSSAGLWKAHAINLSELFAISPGSLYQVELSFTRDQVLYNCEDVVADSSDDYIDYADAMELDEAEREEQYWDNQIYRWRTYTYNWEERDNPCHPAYYNEDRIVSTNILGSDLGLIVKKGKNRAHHFAATNLLTAEPEPNTTIRLYNYQQQLVHTATTDGEGFTIFDSDRNLAFAVAQKGNNYAYVKLDDGNALSMSKFDISGKELQKGLKGFIYTERGVHRPGDSIHLTFVLNDNANPLPKGHPVVLEVKDARGKLVSRNVQSKNTPDTGTSLNNFYYFPIATGDADPTGNWNATVSVGGVNFSKTLKVATVKPNRLKINLDFNQEVLTADTPISGTAEALWLHGAVARNLKIEMDATLRATRTAFEGYESYRFNDPVRSFGDIEMPIMEGQLSDNGTLKFNKKLDISNRAPGMLKATFLTKVFEGGGDFSLDVFSKNLAPYTHFVGLQSPDPRRYGSYYTDENTTFDVISLDAQGEISKNRSLEVKVFKIEWRWWWNRGRDNLSRYENARVHRPYKTYKISTDSNGKGSFTVNIPDNDGGRFLIRVIDTESGHATGRTTYFYRNWWRQPAGTDAESSKMLVFSADKEKYNVGEEALITFPSSGEGRALLTIENGTEVLGTQWIETSQGETTTRLKLTEEMTPNIYVNIALLQPHAQTANDLPIRLYGVIPMLVEDPATILTPELDMPEVLEPESDFEVVVSEKNSKPMTYTIAVVDEGLLDLTRFKTPDIHNAFYSREALGVKSFDIFDYIIGAYSGSVNNIYAVGGGDEGAGAKNRKADRFKPVVRFMGPFELDKGKSAKHQISMPNYVGSVRTMIVAGDAKKAAYGKTEKATPVRKPLMVLASVPRKLSPGETLTLPVTVFAMENKVKNANIKVTTSDAFSPISGTQQSVRFDRPGEEIVNFQFKVNEASTFQTIKVEATGAGEKASYELEVDVVNPNPITQKVSNTAIDPNQEITLDFETFGVNGTNVATLELSTLPPMNFSKRLEYLIRYPHGCIEQTTSGAFPQLFLADIFDLTFDKKQKMEENVKAAINRLSNFQRPSGGFSYWPGQTNVNDWATSYAGHFMLEAKQRGYSLPISFMSSWLQYQKTTARQWRVSETRYNSSHFQAYRLYTLALAGQPELAAMNRLRESGKMNNDAKWRLAAAYALAGKDNVANDILKSANIDFISREYDYYSYGSPFRNRAMALETMVLLKDERQRDMAMSLARNLSSAKWYSTQETSYALLALSKMVIVNGGKSLDVNFSINDQQGQVKTDRALSQRSLNITNGLNKITLRNNQSNVIYVSVVQQGKLPLGQELSERRNLSVKTDFLDGEGERIDVSEIRQGTEISARVTVTNSSSDYIDNIALTQIFPSGWEIVNTSFTELGGGASGQADYKDIRDDRVNFYFDLRSRKSKTFKVRLNASYLGDYYLPGVQAEAMYDNNFYARDKGRWIKVVQ